MEKIDNVDSINLKTMRRSVSHYRVIKNTWTDELTPAERAALSVIADEARNKPILDLGVGGGRTVKALHDISQDYIGADFAQEMVAECRKRFPDVRFEHADARQLSQFRDNTFFLVMFSCNGICMVDHQGRMAILSEVHRLLQPGGVFLFSTFNRNGVGYNKFIKPPDFEPTKNFVKLAVRAGRFAYHFLIRLVNRLRFKRLERNTDEYSIINDVWHDYATMHYYISLEKQRNQLRSVGFKTIIEVFESAGQRIINDTTDEDFFIVARK